MWRNDQRQRLAGEHVTLQQEGMTQFSVYHEKTYDYFYGGGWATSSSGKQYYFHLSIPSNFPDGRPELYITDPNPLRADTPGTVEGNPVFMYHDAFNPDVAEVEDLKARYRLGKVGDVEVKNKLAKALNAHLEPIRSRRAELLAKPGTLREILHEGSRKAQVVARETMERVRAAVKLKY